MNEFLIIKLLHLLGFAYWLGGDLGVFHSSFYVADSSRPPEVRVAAAKILFWLDQAPRICMTMMLPLGVHLTWRLGIFTFGTAVMVAIWMAAFGWLAMVIYLHAAKPSTGKYLLTTFDFWFRLALSLALLAFGFMTLFGATESIPNWVAIKLAIFGGLIGCGLMVRIKLKEFGPAFANIAQGNASDADNAAITRSLGGVRPYVVAIWAGLIASAALGIHLV